MPATSYVARLILILCFCTESLFLFRIGYYLLYFAKGSDSFTVIYIRYISDVFENFIVIIKYTIVLLKQTTFCS